MANGGRLRIGVFTDSYLPYVSGVVRSVQSFTKELRELGHEVYIFAPNYPDAQPEPGLFRFPSLPALTFREFSLALPIWPGLSAVIRSLGLDIIHSHSPFVLGSLGARYAHKYSIPLVFTYHTLYEQYVHYFPLAPGLSKMIVEKYTADYCNRCQLVVVPTRVIKEKILADGVKVPIKIIPTGIDVKRFASGDPLWLRQRLKLGTDRKIVLSVGRLGKEKNVEFLLDAFALAMKEVPEACLVLVGTGPLEGLLREQAQRLGIADNMFLMGRLDASEIVHAYAGADVFAIASLTETQGLVTLEAKAAGLPVVAVDAFGSREMVNSGQDGFLVPLKKEIFADRLVQLLKHSELRKAMGQEAKRRAQDCSARASALKLIGAYREAIERRQGASPSRDQGKVAAG